MINKKEYKTILDIALRFNDEKACHQYLAGERWSSGILECPHDDCNSQSAYVFKDGIRYKCKECKRLYTAKTNTFMDSSKLPTVKWLMAMYLITHKKGISSIQLSKDIGITQKTAWFVLHRVRWAFGNEVEQDLTGVVQLDETFVGGKNKNRHHDKKVANSQGRSFKDKTPVMGMLQQQVYEIVERPHKVIAGHTVKEKVIISQSVLRCRVVKDTKANTLQPIINDNVRGGAILVSDEWWGYRGLNMVYSHEVVDHRRKQYVNDSGFTSNHLEGAWKAVKASVQSTYHQVTRKHLQRYVEEFEFRYNNRNLGAQQQIECIIAQMNCRLKYKDLIKAA